MPTVEVRGIPVNDHEVADGRPVLLLHGMPVDQRHIARSFEPPDEEARSACPRILAPEATIVRSRQT